MTFQARGTTDDSWLPGTATSPSEAGGLWEAIKYKNGLPNKTAIVRNVKLVRTVMENHVFTIFTDVSLKPALLTLLVCQNAAKINYRQSVGIRRSPWNPTVCNQEGERNLAIQIKLYLCIFIAASMFSCCFRCSCCTLQLARGLSGDDAGTRKGATQSR